MTDDSTGSWEETFQVAEQEAIEEGATIYTVKQEVGETVFFSLILTPKAKQPTWMGYFESEDEAVQKTKADYGESIVYVTPETMKQEWVKRKEAQKG